MTSILICIEESERRDKFQGWLAAPGRRVEAAANERELMEQLLSASYDAAVVSLPTLESLRVLALVRKIAPALPLIAVTADDSLDFERQVRKEKIFYYLVEPVGKDEFRAAVESAALYSQTKRHA